MPLSFVIARYFAYAFAAVATAWLASFMALSAAIDAGFVYVSDHGESLGEGGLYLHGAPYFMAPSEQIRVPMVMWLSKDWSRTFGFDAANLAREPAGGVTHEHLYSTVLGMLGVQSTTRRPRWDLTDNRSSAAQ